MGAAVNLTDGYRGTRTVLSGTDDHTAEADGHTGWTVIQILADGTQFTTLTDAGEVEGGGDLTAKTFDKGDILFGIFTHVTRAAGEYRLYVGPS
jgi:hypothetical protein